MAEVERRPPPDELPVLFWSAAETIRSDGKLFMASDQLRRIRGDDVADRVLPAALAAAGMAVDPSVRRSGGLNQIMFVTGQNTTGTYLKTEENAHAVRAEIIASALLKGMNWVGIAERVTASESGSVLIVPELGTTNVRDLGAFSERFRHLPNEDPRSMTCERPQSLKRVTLPDLCL